MHEHGVRQEPTWATHYDADRIQKWRQDLEFNLGVSLEITRSFPSSLKPHPRGGLDTSGINQATIGDAPTFHGTLADGRSVFIQIHPQGHYFRAAVYAPDGTFMFGNNDYFWQEFKDTLDRNPAQQG